MRRLKTRTKYKLLLLREFAIDTLAFVMMWACMIIWIIAFG